MLFSGQGTNDETNDVYYMGNMPDGSLERCVLVMLVGCSTAVDPPGPDPSVLDAFFDEGAAYGIGTLGDVFYPWANRFSDRFWEDACRNETGLVTIEDAFEYARDNSGTPDEWKWVWHYEASDPTVNALVRPAHYK